MFNITWVLRRPEVVISVVFLRGYGKFTNSHVDLIGGVSFLGRGAESVNVRSGCSHLAIVG